MLQQPPTKKAITTTSMVTRKLCWFFNFAALFTGRPRPGGGRGRALLPEDFYA